MLAHTDQDEALGKALRDAEYASHVPSPTTAMR
jgi:hypothetical protein